MGPVPPIALSFSVRNGRPGRHCRCAMFKNSVDLMTGDRSAPATKILSYPKVIDRSRQPAHGRVVHGVRSRDLGDGLAALSTVQRFPSLMRCHLWSTPEAYPALLGSKASFTGPHKDQFTLELGEAAEHG